MNYFIVNIIMNKLLITFLHQLSPASGTTVMNNRPTEWVMKQLAEDKNKQNLTKFNKKHKLHRTNRYQKVEGKSEITQQEK